MTGQGGKMAGFSLIKGADTFNFDITGPVSKGGNRIGVWSTDKNNNIVVTKDAGGQDSHTVSWQFNQDNQLTISSGGKAVFNFNGTAGVRPVYFTVNSVLKVRPDQNNVFGFDLRGEWDLDSDTHDLTLTINGVKSVLDGFIQDPRSRFMYHFFNKQNLLQESILGFVGEWQFLNEEGVPKMNFKYQREDGSSDTFSLPKGITVNRSINQFMYQYNKQDHTFGVQFVGMLQVNSELQLTYSIDRQVSQSGAQQVAATTFTFGAVLNKKNVSGDIEFFVKKTSGAVGTTTIGLSGNWTAKLGANQLTIGFTFTQVRGPNTVTTTFGLSGSLKLGGGGQVVWAITKNSTQTTISIAASDITLGPARLDGRLNIVGQNGHVVGVQMLFGIAF
jgi:hypothetical protein